MEYKKDINTCAQTHKTMLGYVRTTIIKKKKRHRHRRKNECMNILLNYIPLSLPQKKNNKNFRIMSFWKWINMNLFPGCINRIKQKQKTKTKKEINGEKHRSKHLLDAKWNSSGRDKWMDADGKSGGGEKNRIKTFKDLVLSILLQIVLEYFFR